MSQLNNNGATTEGMEGFYLFRLSLSKNSFELEKGVLKSGSVHFTSEVREKLPFTFEPSFLRFSDNIDSLIKILQQKLDKSLDKENRVALILPKEWGFTIDIPYPGELSEDDLKHHILWSAKSVSWEDPENLHLNYRKINHDKIRISGVRQRVIDFAHEIANRLSFKLLQLSLAETTYLNLIAPDALSTVDTVEPDTELPETITEDVTQKDMDKTDDSEPEPTPPEESESEPEEEDAKVNVSKTPPVEKIIPDRPYRRTPATSLIWILIVLAICVIGYLGYTFYGGDILDSVNSILSKPESPEIQAVDDSLTLDTVVVSQDVPEVITPKIEPLYSTLPVILQQNGELLFFSMTGDLVRIEIKLPGKNDIDRLIGLLDTTALVLSSSCPYSRQTGKRYAAIINCKINEEILNTYRHPPVSEVFDLISNEGIKVVRGVYNGSIEGIEQILQILDENKILLYRIVVAKENHNRYSLSLEY